jgi:hypothetical protein
VLERPGLKYLVVVEYPSGRRDKAHPICDSWRDAMGLCVTIKTRAPSAKFIVLYHEREWMLDSLYQKLLAGEVPPQAVPGDEIARRTYESGEGGDHDTPYQFEMPRWFPTTAAWARLLARVHRGELGGPGDGARGEHLVSA